MDWIFWTSILKGYIEFLKEYRFSDQKNMTNNKERVEGKK